MKKIKSNNIAYAITLVLFIIFTLAPIVWCFRLSVTPEAEIISNSKSLLPSAFTWDNYKAILEPGSLSHEALFGGLKNSLFTSVITILIGIPITVLTGYTFSRYKFKGKKLVANFILITIVIPVFTTIIPIYSFFSDYGLLDNLFWISVIYVSSFIPINTWIIMNYFNSLPKELWESASVDGANELQTFFRIILPVSQPIILTCVLMMFLMSWNQFQIPLILTSTQENKVVTLILSEFMSRDAISYGKIAVCGVFSILPPAVVAIIFRKNLISGLASGSVKG